MGFLRLGYLCGGEVPRRGWGCGECILLDRKMRRFAMLLARNVTRSSWMMLSRSIMVSAHGKTDRWIKALCILSQSLHRKHTAHHHPLCP